MSGPALYVAALCLGLIKDIGSVPRMGFSARHRGRAGQDLESLCVLSVVCKAKPMGTFENDGDGAQTQRHRVIPDARSLCSGFATCVDVVFGRYRERFAITKLNEIWPTGCCCDDNP
jgi:hypothetical protein